MARQFGVDPNAAYSGTRVMSSEEGQVEMFVRQSGAKMRMDMNAGGQDVAIIVRQDLGLSYLLMPSMNTYRSVNTRDYETTGSDLFFSDIKEVGRETVDGVDCRKIKAKFKDAEGTKSRGHYWVSDDGVLMKIDMTYRNKGRKGERLILTMRDVVVGSQDAEHFEVPADYREISLSMSSVIPSGTGDQSDGGDATMGDKVKDVAEEEAEKKVLEKARDKVKDGLDRIFGD
ncbi:MAG: DUF4412 domain-containing protein [Pseudomonadota bacterium]